MKKLKLTKEKIALSLILVLSFILNFANIGIEGYANQYYAAGVKSMTLSLKNFFFVSFDPTSFVSIDKPPLGFWMQAISAKIFGYSGWSIILPQAIAGVISVWLIYVIVKRSFGSAAGLISAICLAVTPVFVADSRNNTCDNLLVMVLLIACLFLSKAAEKGKLKYLLISLAFVGAGFNIKMLQAYMIIPAIYITYLLTSAASVKKRIIHLVAGTLVLLVVSLSWTAIVDLTPAKYRPYVGSSSNNTVTELIIGHNGLERLGLSSSSTTPGSGQKGMGGRNSERFGNFNMNQGQSSGGTQGKQSNTSGNNQGTSGQMPNFNGNNQGNPGQPPSSNGNNQGSQGQMPNANGNNQGTPPGGFNSFNSSSGTKGTPPNFNGEGFKGMMPNGNGTQRGNGSGMSSTFGGQEPSSIARLFSNNSLSDQIIWLFPLAIFGFIAAAIKEKFNKHFDNSRKLDLIMWLMWLLPEFIYFSFTTGLFHPYYLTMLAPPIAALAGIGIVSMWKLYNDGGWKSWILPVALIANTATQLLLLSYYYDSSVIAKLLTVIVAALCSVASLALIVANLTKHKNEDGLENISTRFKKTIIGVALAGLLITPTIWSATTIFYKMAGSFPSAGLSLVTSGQKGTAMDDYNTNSSNSKLISFLVKHKTNEKYILVTSSTTGYASDIIIKTGQNVMALGGFFGTDKVITLTEFKKLVKNGEIRYVMVGGQGNSSNDIMKWVQQNGKVVSESEWKDSDSQSNKTSNNTNKTNTSSSTQFHGMGRENSEQLYDLKSYTDSTEK